MKIKILSIMFIIALLTLSGCGNKKLGSIQSAISNLATSSSTSTNGVSSDGKMESKDSPPSSAIQDETPNLVMPMQDTVIKFEDAFDFRVGDSLALFKAKFGEGEAGKDGNLKADKEFCFLKYPIKGLAITFTSLDGDDFKKYDVSIEAE